MGDSKPGCRSWCCIKGEVSECTPWARPCTRRLLHRIHAPTSPCQCRKHAQLNKTPAQHSTALHASRTFCSSLRHRRSLELESGWYMRTAWRYASRRLPPSQGTLHRGRGQIEVVSEGVKLCKDIELPRRLASACNATAHVRCQQRRCCSAPPVVLSAFGYPTPTPYPMLSLNCPPGGPEGAQHLRKGLAGRRSLLAVFPVGCSPLLLGHAAGRVGCVSVSVSCVRACISVCV